MVEPKKINIRYFIKNVLNDENNVSPQSKTTKHESVFFNKNWGNLCFALNCKFHYINVTKEHNRGNRIKKHNLKL